MQSPEKGSDETKPRKDTKLKVNRPKVGLRSALAAQASYDMGNDETEGRPSFEVVDDHDDKDNYHDDDDDDAGDRGDRYDDRPDRGYWTAVMTVEVMTAAMMTVVMADGATLMMRTATAATGTIRRAAKAREARILMIHDPASTRHQGQHAQTSCAR